MSRSRNKEKVNYKEPNNFRIASDQIIGPKVKPIAKVPRHEQYTIYNEWKRHRLILDFEDDVDMENNSGTEWYPLCINEIVTVDGEPAIRAKIETKTEIGSSLILEKEWIPEMYLGALAAIKPNEISDKKWRRIYDTNKLPDNYCTKYSVNDKVYLTIIIHCDHINKCKCDQYRIIVYGTIKAVDAHKLALQLTPQFLFEADDKRLAPIANGWVFTAQLSRAPVQWRNITISEIIIFEIRHYRSIGYHKATSSVLIIGDIPKDLDINNAYFMQYECYMAQQVQYRLALKSGNLICFFAKQALEKLIKNTYLSISIGSTMLSLNITRKASKNNVLLYGVPLEPIIMEIGINELLRSLSISKTCKIKNISFTLSVENLERIDISKVLDIFTNKKEIHLNQQITFVWERKYQHLFISKFSISKKDNS